MPNRIDIGKMDRLVVAQSRAETKSSKGQVTGDWVDAFSFFAAQNDVSVAESFSKIGFIAPVATILSTHYRADLVRTMRIKLEDEYWNIITISRDKIFMNLVLQRQDD